MGICKPCFIAYFSSEQVRDILSQNNEDYTETVVYQLTEGCVRLEAVIQHTGSVSFLGMTCMSNPHRQTASGLRMTC